MSSKSTVTVTVGVSGSGKTYYRCAWFLLEEWLPNHEGKLISNYPIKVDELEKAWNGASSRIELIPRDVLTEWREGRSGPWDYFNGRDISGCHIAIDEIHNYCGKNTDNKIRKKWLQFLGELRHQGATIEFLTQSEAKCAKEILNEAEIRLEIINGENRIFPVLGYRMGDLYEFRAKLLGRYLCPSFCREYLQAGGKWTLQKEHIFYRLPKYFEIYDSYSAPEHGKALGHKAEKRPWEKYSWPMLFVWFYLQYPLRIMFHVSVVVLFVYMTFLGGCSNVATKYFNALEQMGKGESKVLNNKVEKRSLSSPQSIEKRKVKDKDAQVSDGGSNESMGYKKVVKLKPYEVMSVDYLRLRDGREFWRGQSFYGSQILYFDTRLQLCFLEDGFYFPIGWLQEVY